MSERWRAVAAALLNPELRAALAEVSAGELTENRRRRALARLEEIGLVSHTPDGAWAFDERMLRSILNENPPARRIAHERFLTRSGRIDRYPVHDADRRELFEWVAGQAFAVDEVLTEREVHERLEPFAPRGDVAVLRRHLVDYSLLERTRSGSEYARVSAV